MSLATVDLGPFHHGTQEQRKAVADQLVDSLRATGFAKMTNTGFPSDVIRASEVWVGSKSSIDFVKDDELTGTTSGIEFQIFPSGAPKEGQNLERAQP